MRSLRRKGGGVVLTSLLYYSDFWLHIRGCRVAGLGRKLKWVIQSHKVGRGSSSRKEGTLTLIKVACRYCVRHFSFPGMNDDPVLAEVFGSI